MGRPRKNRLGEYAGLLVEEMERRLMIELREVMHAMRRAHAQELSELRGELRALRKRLDRATRKRPSAVGRWVPGGPGRPPKDAHERVAAFTGRTARRRKR